MGGAWRQEQDGSGRSSNKQLWLLFLFLPSAFYLPLSEPLPSCLPPSAFSLRLRPLVSYYVCPSSVGRFSIKMQKVGSPRLGTSVTEAITKIGF